MLYYFILLNAYMALMKEIIVTNNKDIILQIKNFLYFEKKTNNENYYKIIL